MLFTVDLNNDYLFMESLMLVWSWIPAVELSSAGSRSLFAGMTQQSTMVENNEAMINIIDYGDCYEEGQVDDFQPEKSHSRTPNRHTPSSRTFNRTTTGRRMGTQRRRVGEPPT